MVDLMGFVSTMFPAPPAMDGGDVGPGWQRNEEESVGRCLARLPVTAMVGTLSRYWATRQVTFCLHNAAAYTDPIVTRHCGGCGGGGEGACGHEPARGVLTLQNHVSPLDDPMVFMALLPYGFLADPRALRWTVAAEDILFRNVAMATFFTLGKCLPIDRKGGLHQPQLLAPIEKLSNGDWVNFFPEGRISFSTDLLPIKRGAARLVLEADPTPIVVPMYTWGMERVKPPKHGQALPNASTPAAPIVVHVGIGPRLEFGDLVDEYRTGAVSEAEAHAKVCDRIGTAMADLRTALLEEIEAHDGSKEAACTGLADGASGEPVSGEG